MFFQLPFSHTDPPGTAQEWLQLDAALYRQSHFSVGASERFKHVFAATGALAVFSAILYWLPLAFRWRHNGVRPALRCWERDDLGYLRPLNQVLHPVMACLYGIFTLAVSILVENDLSSNGYTGPSTIICEGVSLVLLFASALSKTWAVLAVAPRDSVLLRNSKIGAQFDRMGASPAVMNTAVIAAPIALAAAILVPLSVMTANIAKLASQVSTIHDLIAALVASQRADLIGTQTEPLANDILARIGALDTLAAHTWTILRWIFICGILALLLMDVLLGFSSFALFSIFWTHLRIIRRAIDRVDDLERMHNAKNADAAPDAARSIARDEYPSQRASLIWAEKVRQVWGPTVERGAQPPSISVSPCQSDAQWHRRKLKAQLSALLRLYGAIGFQLVAIFCVHLCVLALCIFVQFVPATSEDDRPIFDKALLIILWPNLGWTTIGAIALPLVNLWLYFRTTNDSGPHAPDDSSTWEAEIDIIYTRRRPSSDAADLSVSGRSSSDGPKQERPPHSTTDVTDDEGVNGGNASVRRPERSLARNFAKRPSKESDLPSITSTTAPSVSSPVLSDFQCIRSLRREAPS